MYRLVSRGAAIAAVLVQLGVTPLASQQTGDPMAGMPGMSGMMPSPLGISMDRMGSGTTWVPDAAPITSLHKQVGDWDLTGHGFAFAQYNHQSGPRGDSQFGSVNWAMLMASRMVGSGMLQLRTMLSLDALGVTARGYPVLLQSGESYQGSPIHDRQHPHDFFMELSTLYLQPIGKKAALELYVAPSGEPALGPVAFMHRPSAMDDPVAPIGHHWQDATHISFGVATVGLFTHQWKLEASVFNGRDPDDHRWNFDFGRLDSYSGRVTFNPDSHWSMTAGYGRIREADDSMHRVTASVLYGKATGKDGQWATSIVYGANQFIGQSTWAHSALIETELVANQSNTFFARGEFVEKSAADLVVADSAAGFVRDRLFKVGAISAGYIREVARVGVGTLGLGIRGAVNFVPSALEPFYGSRTPVGLVLFGRLRPSAPRSEMVGMPGMGH